ncbi:LANO_0D00320g1_1 [Lachancea nothofagi CBS 11611]|uniref:LANO_0D00320g1_1 n=1 Tax=Lachancea nothofagi CBS 11611 TaxID=1266666 RepID=A0A1G4JCW0_9SACH|nr:LANO_0D00320g1_1 [Lachancea nothofagi CBS 11611]
MKYSLSLATAALSLAAKASAEVFIVDNDTPTALQVLLPLAAGKQVLGITTNLGDYDTDAATYEAAMALATGNLTSCVPVYKGAEQPLVLDYNTYHLWQDLYGDIVWQGAWGKTYESPVPANATYEYNQTVGAPQWIMDTIKNSDDNVTIVAAGTMTNLALALAQWPSMAEKVKLVIMGGYVDGQIAQVTGGDFVNDLYSDFNLMIDPEAAQAALSAPWRELVIVGNISSEVFPTQNLYNELIAVSGGLAAIKNTPSLSYVEETVGNGTLPSFNLPFWDEVASAIAADPEIVTGSYEAYVSVDTSFSSPFYGSLRMYPKDLRASKGVRTSKATMITSIDVEKFNEMIVDALVRDWSNYCSTGDAPSVAIM